MKKNQIIEVLNLIKNGAGNTHEIKKQLNISISRIDRDGIRINEICCHLYNESYIEIEKYLSNMPRSFEARGIVLTKKGEKYIQPLYKKSYVWLLFLIGLAAFSVSINFFL